MKKHPRLLLFLLADLALSAAVFALLGFLPPPIPCADATAQRLGLALLAGLGLQLWARTRSWPIAATQVALLLLIVWLGFYPLSPLFADGHIALLRGFRLTTRTRGVQEVPPGDVVTLVAGTPVAIQPLTLITDVRCRWMSSFGGVLDDQDSCAVAYLPPNRDYDVLKISLSPGCGLPHSVEQLKIAILP